jgi:hypothetical protein
MKSPYLLPGLSLLAGLIGFALFPNSNAAYSISGVLSALGIVGLIYVRGQRTKR